MDKKQMETEQSDSPIVLIDGTCILCQGAMKFIIRRDPVGRFYFASLQSEIGQKLLINHNIPIDAMNTLVLMENNRIFTQSTAALRIARQLRGIWPLFYGFIIIPPFIRDRIYQYIARHRYQWFGKSDQCILPTPELQGKLLE
ncbi:thiol-disulfide oxidoreductase DCC family protein [Paenibacillus sp. CMAA1364]